MTDRRISLTLVLHNHQPVGNFGFVFEDNYTKAYEPMLAALQRHPGVRLGLHYTGPLLDWFKAYKPEALEQLRLLVDRGQVEMLGGGYYEPVLASLREVDRVGQLTRMADEVQSLFGGRPRGAWLAERVWEPDVPTSLVKAGYTYTIVDDAHFRAAAIPAERHWGSYSTDDQGYRVLVFGSEQGLRYRIPFRPVEEVIEYLREHATEAGELVGMMGDDGEKFGTWPGTWELCYGKGQWVERFFTALEENAGWLRMLQPSEALQEHPPIGRVYLPTGSYAEMGEWSLPVEARREFTHLLHEAVEQDKPEARWMRGGFWRSFQINYREINDLHKQMLRVSRKVDALRNGRAGTVSEEQLARIADHLYQGQSNDCYWHGLFGGIYLSHMRLATLEHLIAAEDAADRAGGSGGCQRRVHRYGGLRHRRLRRAAGQRARPDRGRQTRRGWRHRQLGCARRAARPGVGHAAAPGGLSRHARRRRQRRGRGAGGRRGRRLHPRPHQGQRAGHQQAALVRRLRAALRPRAPAADGDHAGAVRADRLPGAGRLRGRLVRGRPLGRRPDRPRARGRATPRLTAQASRCGCASPSTSARTGACPRWTSTVDVTNAGDRPVEALLGIEWALNMLGGGGNPSAWYAVGGDRGRFDARRAADAVDHVSMGNDYIGIELESRPQPAASAWWSSIETISVSESGFEGNHQGGCLLWVWPLSLAPGASSSVRLANLVRTFVDRAEEEGL